MGSCAGQRRAPGSPEVVDHAVRGFGDQSRCPCDALAVDGKSADGELMRGRDRERTLVAAIEHSSGLALGQVASSTGGGEILGARRLLREIDIEGRVVTLDALHAQLATARLNRPARRTLPLHAAGPPPLRRSSGRRDESGHETALPRLTRRQAASTRDPKLVAEPETRPGAAAAALTATDRLPDRRSRTRCGQYAAKPGAPKNRTNNQVTDFGIVLRLTRSRGHHIL